MKTTPIFCVLSLLFLFPSCHGGKEESPLMRSVESTRPATLSAYASKSFSGVVKEGKEISLGFKTPGQITKILVKEGDRVEEGQLLATLDDADYKLGVEAIEIQYDQLKKEVDRMKLLYENNSISGNDYDKATSGLAQLAVQLQSNRNKLDYTRLYAPASGYIQSVNFETAEMVDAGTPVFTLLDTRQMEVTVDIPASLHTQQNRINSITCRSVLSPEKKMTMHLVSIAPKADGNQLYKMTLEFDKKPGQEITPGMNVEVELRLRHRTSSQAYTLPLHCIFNHEGQNCVWVINNDSTVSRHVVSLDGTDEEGRAIVVDGLSGDEHIVNAGVNALRDNEKVRIIEPVSPTNVGGLL